MRYIYIICFTLLYSLTGQAQTKRTINVATAGTLPNYISESEKYTIEELTLTGELNGTDFRLLRDMVGNNYKGEVTEGKLKILDLSGAKVVAGGEMYLDTDWIETTISGLIPGGHYTIETPNVLPQYVFAGFTRLTSLYVPNSVTSIGEGVFSNCTNLTSISIPSSVTSIGKAVFYYCISLTSITIPNSVTNIGIGAFCGCSGLTSITIPNSVTSIGGVAFYGCSGLTSITIPNSVTSIEYETFHNCNSLTSITIPNSVTSIGFWAFLACTSLTSITIPNSVTSIGYEAFCGCISLTSITIPNSVTSMGYGVFELCDGLTSVISEIQNPFAIDNGSFPSDTYTKATLTVPYGTKSKYQSTNGWNNFTNIVESGGSTSMDEIPTRAAADETVVIYSLGGQKVVTCKQADFDSRWLNLPSGVYIVNGKKRIR